jgi:hypothetical protein
VSVGSRVVGFVKAESAELLLVLLSYAFRFPALLNADSTNSDAAVVGLQATHILGGETSRFLWGSGYQTSVDSFVAAGFFAVLGKSPWALMMSALTLHVAATVLVFRMLARHVEKSAGFVLSLLLVFTPSSVHSYALYPPREASLFLALAAFAAIDRAAVGTRRNAFALYVGCALSTLATYADPYALLLAPLSLLLAALLVIGSEEKTRLVAAGVAGAVTGAFPSILVKTSDGAKNGPLGLKLELVSHNFDLFVHDCLPWAMSTKIYYAKHVMDYSPWEPPGIVSLALFLCALSFAGLLALSGVSAFSRSLEWNDKRVGVVGLLVFPLGCAGFMTSVMVMDHFSMRYLAAITLLSPLALLPLAKRVRPRTLAFALAPYLLSSAIGGWVGYGPFVRGPVPVRPVEIADDYALLALLHEKGIKVAIADYWTAYRLTFLFHEDPIFVPKNEGEDRYAPYRRTFESAPRFAYVFDPGRSRENKDDALRDLREHNANVEELRTGALTVWLVTRASAGAAGGPSTPEKKN